MMIPLSRPRSLPIPILTVLVLLLAPAADGAASGTGGLPGVSPYVPPDPQDPLFEPLLYRSFAEPVRAAEAIPPENRWGRGGRLHLAMLIQAGRDREALEVLSENPGLAPPSGGDLFLKGYLRCRLGRREAAARDLDRFLAGCTGDLVPVARALRALVSPPADDDQFRAVMGLLQEDLPVGLRSALEDTLEASVAAMRGRPDVVLELARVLRKVHGGLPSELIQVEEAAALHDTGKDEEARWLLSDLLARLDQRGPALRAVALLDSLFGSTLTFRERVDRAETLLRAEDTERAASGLEDLLERSDVRGGDRERVRLLLAKRLYVEKRYRSAAQRFEALADELEEPRWRGEALLYLARSLVRSHRLDLGLETYVRLAEEHPEHPLAGEALYVAARRFENEDRVPRARELYASYLERFPGGEFAGEAQLALALAAYRSEDLESARRTLVDLFEGADAGLRESAAYWLTRLEKEAGPTGEMERWQAALRERSPRTFYALLIDRESGDADPAPDTSVTGGPRMLQHHAAALASARDRLQRAVRRNTVTGRTGGTLAAGDHRRLRRAIFFLEWGCLDLARGDLEPLERAWARHPDRLASLLDLYASYGLAHRGIRVATRLSYLVPADERQDFRDEIRPFLYPLPFLPTVVDVADREGISPELLLAVMREESWFDATARSRAGARGLMQLMPATGRQLARELELPFEGEETLADPVVNIRLGARYLDRLKNEHNGEDVFALTSYNGGPHRVRRWLRSLDRAGDPALFVDTLEFRETRKYVKKVLRSRWVYHQFLRNSGA
jgi:soluble lytic murein transglycosylase-like protein/tetratricopeptide (TPR) repeat protein